MADNLTKVGIPANLYFNDIAIQKQYVQTQVQNRDCQHYIVCFKINYSNTASNPITTLHVVVLQYGVRYTVEVSTLLAVQCHRHQLVAGHSNFQYPWKRAFERQIHTLACIVTFWISTTLLIVVALSYQESSGGLQCNSIVQKRMRHNIMGTLKVII